MIKQKGRFLTFIFSLCPGAGHMYLGFMKQGLSLLTFFFGFIFIVSFLRLELLFLFLPVIWLYGFLDAMNKNSLTFEEFQKLEDHYIFHSDEIQMEGMRLGHFRPLAAILLIGTGCYLILDNLFEFLLRYFSMPEVIREFLYRVMRTAPQILFAVIIILIGVRLIMGKKKELDQIETKEEN